jgi:hypothetical protein
MFWHFKFCWSFLSFLLQKFNDEEWVNMPTCNMAKTVHNIWLQQLGKCSTYLYIATPNNYTHVFKQSTLYKQYLQGGPSGHGLDRNELSWRAQRLNDHAKLAIVVANCMSGSSFTNCLLHLEGDKVFGSSKRFVDCPLSLTMIPIVLTMSISLIHE